MEYPYTDGGKNQWLYPYYPGVSGRPGQGSNRQEHGDAVHRSRPSNHTEHQIPGAVGKTLSYSKPVGSPSAGGAEDRQDGTGAVHASPQRTQLPYRQEGGDPGTTHTPIVNESGETVDLRTAKERRAAAMWRYKQKRKVITSES